MIQDLFPLPQIKEIKLNTKDIKSDRLTFIMSARKFS